MEIRAAALNLIERLRQVWEDLNERERKLMLLLGITLAVLILFLPAFLAYRSVSEIADENEAIRDALRQMETRSGELSQRRAQRLAAERRYRTKPPSLGSFLEERTRQAGVQLGSVTDEADERVGGFLKRTTRARLDNINLRALVQLMTLIENSGFAIAIDFVRIEHFRSGDSYDVELGLSSFEKSSAPAGADDED